MKKILLLLPFAMCACGGGAEKKGVENSDSTKTAQGINTNPDNFRQFLNTVNTSSPDAISKAVLHFKTDYVKNSPENCDQEFVDIKNFSIKTAMDLNATTILPDLRNESGQIEKVDVSKFKKLGLIIKYAEGEPYFMADPEYLLDHFSNCISSEMTAFMKEFVEENNVIAVQEEALEIPVSELQRRLVFWDKFMIAHPDFILFEECRVTYHFYLSLYVTGTGLSFAFDYETRILNQEFLNSYKELIKESPGSPTGTFITNYLQVLEKNDLRYSEEVEQFYMSARPPFEAVE